MAIGAVSNDEGSNSLLPKFNAMLHNSFSTINSTLWDSVTWDLIITWSLVRKGRFVSVGIYHARASLSHRSPRCPGESDFQLACCFQMWSTDWYTRKHTGTVTSIFSWWQEACHWQRRPSSAVYSWQDMCRTMYTLHLWRLAAAFHACGTICCLTTVRQLWTIQTTAENICVCD